MGWFFRRPLSWSFLHTWKSYMGNVLWVARRQQWQISWNFFSAIFVKIFLGRCIRKIGAIEWPPQFLDLSPMNFFLWECLKSKNLYAVNRTQAQICDKKLLMIAIKLLLKYYKTYDNVSSKTFIIVWRQMVGISSIN